MLAVDPDGCSYSFGSAWNFALACRGTASSFIFSAVVAAAIAAIAAIATVIAAFAAAFAAALAAAIAAVIAVLLFRRSRWLLCASLAVWLYLDFMSLLKSS
jgi:hypothetical protein